MCYDPLNNADWFLALLWFRVVATAVTYMRRVYTRYGFFGNRCVARGLVIWFMGTVVCVLTERVWRNMSLGLLLLHACIWLAKQKRVWCMPNFLSSTWKNFVNSFLFSASKIFLSFFCLSFWWDWMLSLSVDADEKFRYEIKDILEMEMKVLEALNFYLVVFHPYRSLPE